ncbi:MAG: oxidoreductase [Proteobacteria bacterium]|nr:oxidoreductase [Pseudomonadota bacterium]
MQAAVGEMQLQVMSLRREADDVLSLRLADPCGARLPAFTPGAHIALRLGEGLVRQYSLCNGPDEDGTYLIAVKREARSRGGSAAVHRLAQGDVVAATLPVNAFAVDWSAPHLVLLAGGIGITPLLSMALHAMQRGHSFELHYFARSSAHAAFHDLLADAPMAPHVVFHFAIEPEAVSSVLKDLLSSRRAGAHLYVCGPVPFMDEARKIAAGCTNLSAVHWEYFTPPAPAEEARASSAVCTVRLARSGKTLEVPANKSILQVLIENGVTIDSSCMEGLCGLCATRVLEGEPDHRDEVLTDNDRQYGKLMTVCVSRAREGVLVLDL